MPSHILDKNVTRLLIQFLHAYFLDASVGSADFRNDLGFLAAPVHFFNSVHQALLFNDDCDGRCWLRWLGCVLRLGFLGGFGLFFVFFVAGFCCFAGFLRGCGRARALASRRLVFPDIAHYFTKELKFDYLCW